MLKKDILKLIENAKDDDNINSLLVGTDIETEFKGEEITLETLKSRIKTDAEMKKFMDSEKDVHSAKVIKTMKENGSWEKEFSDILKTKYPELIVDPLQLQLNEERKKREDLESKLARKDLLAQATVYATEKKLPTKFVERCLAEDMDATKLVIDEMSKTWSDSLEEKTTERMKKNSYEPGQGADGKTLSIGASMAAKFNEVKTEGSDPWNK